MFIFFSNCFLCFFLISYVIHQLFRGLATTWECRSELSFFPCSPSSACLFFCVLFHSSCSYAKVLRSNTHAWVSHFLYPWNLLQKLLMIVIMVRFFVFCTLLMPKCWGQHSCWSSTFSIIMLYVTCFFHSHGLEVFLLVQVIYLNRKIINNNNKINWNTIVMRLIVLIVGIFLSTI